LNSDTLGSYLN